MHNLFYLIGRITSFKQVWITNQIYVTIKVSTQDGDIVIPVYFEFDNRKQISDLLQLGALIGVKGNITIDKDNNIKLIVNKFNMLSANSGGKE